MFRERFYTYDVYDDVGGSLQFTITSDIYDPDVDANKKPIVTLKNFEWSDITILTEKVKDDKSPKIIELNKSQNTTTVKHHDKYGVPEYKFYGEFNPTWVIRYCGSPSIFFIDRFSSICQTTVNSLRESQPLTSQLADSIKSISLEGDTDTQISIISSRSKNSFKVEKDIFFKKFPVFKDSIEFDKENSSFTTDFTDNMITMLIDAAFSGVTFGQIELGKEHIQDFIDLATILDYLGYEYNNRDITEMREFMKLMNKNELMAASINSRKITEICVECFSKNS